MKYTKLFQTNAEYEAFVNSSKYVEPHVSLCIAEDIIHYNRPVISEPGDVVLADTDGKYYVINANKLTESILIKGYTVEGVVLVPSNHTDDGTTRILSLASMDYSNPENGNTSSNITMMWGGYNVDIPELPNLISVPTTANDGSTTVGVRGSAYLPSDNFTGVQSIVDSAAKYYNYTPYCPSPYLSNGDINLEYRKEGTATADFNGKNNTDIIIAHATGQTDWQTASTIVISSDAGYYPAACCCARYHTTKTSDWYLPAEGEMGYLVARFKAINDAIARVKNLGVNAITVPSGWFWSSSECSSGLARFVSTDDGYVYYDHKDYNSYVRAAASVVVSSRIC